MQIQASCTHTHTHKHTHTIQWPRMGVVNAASGTGPQHPVASCGRAPNACVYRAELSTGEIEPRNASYSYTGARVQEETTTYRGNLHCLAGRGCEAGCHKNSTNIRQSSYCPFACLYRTTSIPGPLDTRFCTITNSKSNATSACFARCSLQISGEKKKKNCVYVM